ncbi:MAG: DUF4019 domain-containing protein [Acidobacteria bacterium]|nr:DUF4019 domain-containing protein [Acidobacteriota bacterium]MCA1641019.1 DUF4019 domain-containing protein [Acidobacteriota bacterium]
MRGERGRRRSAPAFACCALALALLSACAADGRRSGLPPGAQEAIDALTQDVADGRFDEVYAAAADEWRATASAEESRNVLARVRDRLGRVQSRVPVSATEQPNAAAGRTLSVSYNTKFERADAIESVTLVERGGRWRLARYSVNSDALK